MNARRGLAITGAAVALLIALLLPLSQLLARAQDEAKANDAQHVIEPMLRLMAQSPQACADVPVEPVMELEDAWTIEDTHSEVDAPPIAGMRNGEAELGYDRASGTFYCTLGMDGGEDWPELALYAQAAEGAQGLRVAWIDDYSYDFRCDAIREGYRYELLAYTDTEYAYFGLVFTGLPIVTVHVEGDPEQIGDDYVPARVSISAADCAPVNACAQVHLRGGGYEKPIEKKSYRVEFHGLSDKGRDEKRALSVLGMEEDTDWLLLGNAQDRTAVRNYMAWQLWNAWNEGSDSMPMLLQSRMAEVFVQDEYTGLYQVMQRVNVQEELVRIGGSLRTDGVVRIVSGSNTSEKPIQDLLSVVNFCFEYQYEPGGNADRLFAMAGDYVTLSKWKNGQLDDAAFAELARRRIDPVNLMNYCAFFHGVGLRDHVFNNLYIWMVQRGEERVYLHSLWDMDTAFWVPELEEELGSRRSIDLNMTLARRMLDQNLMNCREILWSIWREKRQGVFSDDALFDLIDGTGEWINASGAYLRESERWYGEAMELNLADALYYQLQNVEAMQEQMWELWPLEGQDGP